MCEERRKERVQEKRDVYEHVIEEMYRKCHDKLFYTHNRSISICGFKCFFIYHNLFLQ